MALTRIPSLACSKANEAVRPLTPPFDAEYGTRLMPRVAIEDKFSMVPFWFLVIFGRNARQHPKVGKNERVTFLVISSSKKSSKRFIQIPPPTLLLRASTRP